MTPDPAAVRAALVRLDESINGMVSETIACICVDERDVATFALAARAWLAEQDGNNQHTRGPVDCRGMKGASE